MLSRTVREGWEVGRWTVGTHVGLPTLVFREEDSFGSVPRLRGEVTGQLLRDTGPAVVNSSEALRHVAAQLVLL